MKGYFVLSLALPVLQAVIGLPLLLGLVPPNRIYGYRTEQSLSSTEAWYALNQSSGFWLVAMALVLLAAVTCVWCFATWSASKKMAASATLAVVSTLIATSAVA